MRTVRYATPLAIVTLALGLGTTRIVTAQGRAAQPPTSPTPSARAAAPIDLTGYWVSIVTEDWRWRMVTPAKGDYASVPINEESRRLADRWDPAKDEAAGEQCRSYGAAGIMRVPGRLHITWQDDSTLKIDTDAGMQTRLLRFAPAVRSATARGTWQGESVASWQLPKEAEAEPRPAFGSLKVVTTHMRPGYLRKNGIPYSADAVMTEFWDLHRERNGEQWITITTLIDDPKYLQLEYVTSPNFKREGDGSKWDPTPCSARW
jgi:hypothetical protein